MRSMPKEGRARYILYDRPRRYVWRLYAPNGKILAEKACMTREERERSLERFRVHAQTTLVEIC